MPRGKLRHDVNEIAFRTLQAATGEGKRPREGKNPEAVARGREGGKKGGKARAKALSPEQRKAAATKASRSRWKKGDGDAT